MIFTSKPLTTFEKRPLLFFDTEFHAISDSTLVDPICYVAITEDGTTYADDFLLDFDRGKLQRLIDAHTIVCHAAMAELSFLHSLSINLDKVQIIDTLAEFSLLINNSEKWGYGKIISGGKQVFSKPPISQEDKKRVKKLDTPEGERQGKSKSDRSLVAFVYKMTGEVVDNAHKKAMQKLCIDYNIEELIDNMVIIVEYCKSDVVYLKKAYLAMKAERDYLKLITDFNDLERGQFSLSMHKATVVGIPVNLDALKKVSLKAGELMEASKQDFIDNTGLPLFRRWEDIGKYNRKGEATKTSLKLVGTKNISVLHDYLLKKYPDITLTESGKPSTDTDTLEFYEHDPVIYQYMQTQKTMNALRALVKEKSDGSLKDEYLFDYICEEDKRLRISNWGIWGTQTGRNAPKASTFILAMAKWLRAFVSPPPGYAIVEVDYSSQESLLAGIVYQDKKIVKAYESGDVYVAFGIQSGILPKDATKDSHKAMRQKLKAVVLGVQYGMGAKLLAEHYASNTWVPPTESEDFEKKWEEHKKQAEKESSTLLRVYKDTYEDLFDSRDIAWEEFQDEGYMPISRNWRLFDALPFMNSVLNSPVQGLGAEIMRRFMYLLTTDPQFGVKCFAPLHDASYCLVPIPNLVSGSEWICEQMLKACSDVITDPDIKHMRVGIDIISPELEEGTLQTKYGEAIVQKVFFSDGNAKKTYLKYEKIFS